MPMNPMQKRAQQSFIIGFLLALIIMAIVVAVLVKEVQKANESLEELKALQRSYVVAADDLKSGQEVNFDEHFTTEKVQTTVDESQVISMEDFEFIDEDGIPYTKLDEEGMEIKKVLTMKVDVPAGTIVTKKMLAESEEITRNDERLVEYNMILLPSQLENGDYVDIRLTLATGETYTIISKQKVEKTTTTGIWMRLNEEEILTLESAIVDSYRITGSRIYALQYAEPGLQTAAIVTYPVSDNIRSIINSNPNIVEEAKQKLFERYNSQEQVVQRNEHIETAILVGGDSTVVQQAVKQEAAAVQVNRETFVAELEGTGRVGNPIE